MEEAGDKVEGNIDEIKTNYSQRMNKLEDIIKKVSFFEFLNIHHDIIDNKLILFLVDRLKGDHSQ